MFFGCSLRSFSMVETQAMWFLLRQVRSSATSVHGEVELRSPICPKALEVRASESVQKATSPIWKSLARQIRRQPEKLRRLVERNTPAAVVELDETDLAVVLSDDQRAVRLQDMRFGP